MGPIQKNVRSPGRGAHRIVLTDLRPVRCWSAFAHTSNAPKNLDPRCSALGREPGASHNGQAIGSGQAYITQTGVLSAAPRLGMLRNLYRLLAPPSAHTTYRHRTRVGVINYWRQAGRQRATSGCPSRLPPAKERGKTAHCSPLAIWFPAGICAKANWPSGEM